MAGEAAVQERRTSGYYVCDLPVSCAAFTGGGEARWQGRATQISNQAIRLCVDRRFERGTVLRIHAGTREDGPVLMLGRVAEVSDEAGGKWGVECHFSPPLDNADLREILRAGA
jgi:hypothetical protein